MCKAQKCLCRCRVLQHSGLAHPYDLVLDEDGKCLFIEAMPLLEHKGAVQAERHGEQNVFASIQQIVDDSDQYFMRSIVAKTRCYAY